MIKSEFVDEEGLTEQGSTRLKALFRAYFQLAGSDAPLPEYLEALADEHNAEFGEVCEEFEAVQSDHRP